MIVLLSSLAMASNPTALGHEDVLDRVGFGVPEFPEVPVGVEPIINGDPFELEDWPQTGAMVVKLGLRQGGRTFEFVQPICSSTLIAPDVVLLAAHCVDPAVIGMSAPGAEIIEFGWDRQANLSTYMFGADYNPDVAIAAQTVLHPDFDIRNFNNFSALGVSKNDDIALMFLDEPLDDVPFAYLPTRDEADQLAEGNDVWVVGWGQRSASDRYSSGVKYGGLSHINELGTHEFQVGGEESDTRKCHGDSGGPSFMAVDGNSAEDYRVVGVTSHAYDLTDCFVTGGVDTRVDAYLDWIEDEMLEACEDGTRSWCDWPGIIPPPDADGYHAWEFNPNQTPSPFGPAATEDGAEADGVTSEGKGGCSTASSTVGFAGALVGLVGLLGRRR